MTNPITVEAHPVAMETHTFRSLRYGTVFQHGLGWYLAIKTVENGTGFNRGVNAVSLPAGVAHEIGLDESVLVPQQTTITVK